MSKILLTMRKTICYELVECDEKNYYGIKGYFCQEGNECKTPITVLLENVATDYEQASEILNYVFRVCALPCELPEIIRDFQIGRCLNCN